MTKKGNEFYYELSKLSITLLLIYYFLIMIIGVFISISIIYNLQKELKQTQLMICTIKASLSASGMLCSLQYIKKLYKACIDHRIISPVSFQGHLGNFVYFAVRPFSACVFVIIMIYGLLSGMFVVTGNLDYIINEKFLYLCVILSSFIGYSVGHVWDKYESISKQQIGHLIERNGPI